jgi:glycosyltransferase involved in cell wall biosynthesis
VFDPNSSMFQQPDSIPEDARVVFVSDVFANEYLGGAELTSQALIDEAPVKVHKIKSKDVTIDSLQKGADKIWVFGNWAEMNGHLIPSIVANLKYVVLEYDFKFCRYRSPEKHLAETGTVCNCDQEMPGKMCSAFYHGSRGVFWMSELQMEEFHKRFPFLERDFNYVLSSVFDKKTLARIKALRESRPSKSGWLTLGSGSWIKGAEAAKKWCADNGKKFETIWGLSYEETLARLAVAEGFCYMPLGGDTCPRMVIEAKLLGCELALNHNVLHADEDWFRMGVEDVEDYLQASPERFWSFIKEIADYVPTVSGYTTTLNCIKQEYPFVQSITSLLGFCSEVCIVDGGSTDGTWEKLQALAEAEPRIKLKQVPRDWKSPRFAVFDGMQKAEARSMCTQEFLWQQDVDEVVHEDDGKKIIHIAQQMPREARVLCFPVIEYWGGPAKVRMDVTPWKWRMTRNDINITHGIPADMRREDELGVYALPGTDGCDLIDAKTGERIDAVNFYTPQVENIRQAAMMGNAEALKQYEGWFNQVVEGLPSVFHYSWFDIKRKIRLYREYWTAHWASLYGKDHADVAENNMMFDVPWSQVTDEMIEARASELSTKLGGWIWHRRWNGRTITPHIKVKRPQPRIMQ